MGEWRKRSVAREKGRGRQWSDTLSICSSHEVEKRRAGRSEREEARWTGGKSQKATDRIQEAEDYRPSPGAGLRGRKTGWFANDADEMVQSTQARVLVPRDCWRAVQGFQLLSPFVCGGCAGGNAG